MSRRFISAVGLLSALASVRGQSSLYGQCGGIGWSGATTCVSGASCSVVNAYYSQCLPCTGACAASPTTSAPTSAPSSTPTAPSGGSGGTGSGSGTGSLKFAGVNIAGFDFGCNTDGSCTASAAWPPLTQYYGMDGAGQMNHFVSVGYNVFRLPVGWQFLVNDVLGADIDQDNLAEYDALVQTCLSTGASCVVDVHNYARWNGKIIGQGGPTNEQFADLWTQLATKYKDNDKIIFGVMNEPHDIPDINAWATSVQAAVTAIRNAGATSQLILLPGNDYTSAAQFISNGSGAALIKVTNPDGSTTGLIFDVHKYLDSDNSGTHAECTTNNIAEAWQPLGDWLRSNGRQAFNTETGGGNVASCVTFMCEQVAFQKTYSDVFLGYIGWAAGNFDPSYVLGEAPTNSGGTWTDTLLVKSCMAPNANA